jgi:hypothetical protein
MKHFTTDNTEGYTAEQLERANRLVDEWCETVQFEPWEKSDLLDGGYQRVCERALRAVETID